MSSDDARNEFDRLEDEAERAMVRLVFALATIITVSWGAALIMLGTDLINKL